ncbi:snoRNA-binding rRNA-processing protein [Cichlidogyrus casuarinus]|uniref:SnoRNA-binding rRNA-processing protein n=1 Tax=Cichlidogyrus casuarinus TaxID=1844966 RepID=A0ABD2QHR2_9PLAT
MYRASSMELYRKVPGFTNKITSLALRHDAKLLAGGDETGFLRVCTTDKMTAHLRRLTAHKGFANLLLLFHFLSYVTKCQFSLDGFKLFSLGSDSLIKLWDISMNEELNRFKVGKCEEPSYAFTTARQNPNLIFAGNHDGVIFTFDIRSVKVQKIKTSSPVIALAINEDDSLLVAASGYNINAWDVSQQSQALFLQESYDYKVEGARRHLKYITDLAVVSHPNSQEGEVILSSGLDKLVRVTKLSDFSDLHQFKTFNSALAVSATKDCSRIVAGCLNGSLHIWSLPEIALVSNEPESTLTVERLKAEVQEKDNLEKVDDMGQPGGVDPKLLQLAQEFSGPGLKTLLNRDEDAMASTSEWMQKPMVGSRKGPKDWGHVGQVAPIIHQDTEISRLHVDEEYSRLKLTKVDVLLKKFRHADALFESLRVNWKKPSRAKKRELMKKGKTIVIKHRAVPDNLVAVSTIRELHRRGTLSAAVAGRTDDEKERFFRFISDNFWRPVCQAPCMLLLKTILTVYKPTELASLQGFKRMHNFLRTETSNLKILDSIVVHTINDSETFELVKNNFVESNKVEDECIKPEISNSLNKRRPRSKKKKNTKQQVDKDVYSPSSAKENSSPSEAIVASASSRKRKRETSSSSKVDQVTSPSPSKIKKMAISPKMKTMESHPSEQTCEQDSQAIPSDLDRVTSPKKNHEEDSQAYSSNKKKAISNDIVGSPTRKKKAVEIPLKSPSSGKKHKQDSQDTSQAKRSASNERVRSPPAKKSAIEIPEQNHEEDPQDTSRATPSKNKKAVSNELSGSPTLKKKAVEIPLKSPSSGKKHKEDSQAKRSASHELVRSPSPKKNATEIPKQNHEKDSQDTSRATPSKKKNELVGSPTLKNKAAEIPLKTPTSGKKHKEDSQTKKSASNERVRSPSPKKNAIEISEKDSQETSASNELLFSQSPKKRTQQSGFESPTVKSKKTAPADEDVASPCQKNKITVSQSPSFGKKSRVNEPPAITPRKSLRISKLAMTPDTSRKKSNQ